MSKAEWGAKYSCLVCGTNFFDMRRQPPTCPKCGLVIETSEESIRYLDHEEIVKRWIHAVSVMSDEHQENKHGHTRKIIDSIGGEWKKQREHLNKLQKTMDFFRWPITDAPPGTRSLSVDSPERGMLAYLGYRVGQKRKLSRERRHILLEIFNGELPPLNSWSYLSEWGTPKSVDRLKKMAESIATFTRNAKRKRGADMADAVSDWEDDLSFLKEELYVGRFGFAWPPTE